jgi:hypothetical protein
MRCCINAMQSHRHTIVQVLSKYCHCMHLFVMK